MHSKSAPLLSAGTILNGRYQVGELVSRGGQGQIFDITDLAIPEPSYPQVVKVVPYNPSTAKKLQTEAEKLSQMHHPGIPNIEGASAFFECMQEEHFLLLSCLVMEKIDGINLSDWLAVRNNQPITQERAIAWLKQLVDILNTVHFHGYLHRDIKPENIMVRANDQLVLIDFGIGREETESYYEKQQRGSLTRAGTVGYQAPEQMEGRSRQASDFFSVGRTLVHLLTGIYPPDLPQGRSSRLLWRNQAPQISDYFADVIDDLMQVDEEKRDRTIQTLAKRIEFIETLPPKGKTVWRELPWVLALGGLISGFWIGIRLLGLLQPFELMAFDWMMRSRPLEEPDPRLVMITINEDDIEYQDQQGFVRRNESQSLSDEALARVLQELYSHPTNHPSLVGIDIYHDFPFQTSYLDVLNQYDIEDNIIYLCEVSSPYESRAGIESPEGVSSDQVGFSNADEDYYGSFNPSFRRHFLAMTPPESSPCRSNYKLSTLIAKKYLEKQGIQTDVEDGAIVLGDVVLEPLSSRSGGYQNLLEGQNHILTNYRSLQNISDIGYTVPLRDFLKNGVGNFNLEEKIILIGVNRGINDLHTTPLGSNAYGVFIQAHEISQLISAVLDGRSLLYPWAIWKDTVWIFFWGFFNIVLFWKYFSNKEAWMIKMIYSIIISSSLALLCYYFFIQTTWVAIVPILCIIFTTNTLMIRQSPFTKIVGFWYIRIQ